MALYDEVGGSETVCTAVGQFYGRVLVDPELSAFFDDVDMLRLQAHQRAFITWLLGGPNEYHGRTMTTAHRDLQISDTDFDAFLANLVDTLYGLGADETVVSQIGYLVAALRHQIVTASAGHKPAHPTHKPAAAPKPAQRPVSH